MKYKSLRCEIIISLEKSCNSFKQHLRRLRSEKLRIWSEELQLKQNANIPFGELMLESLNSNCPRRNVQKLFAIWGS